MTIFLNYAKQPINALRRRLTIEVATDTPDGGGGVTRVWQAAGQAWAMVEPVQGRAEVIGQAPEQVVTHRVTMRWRDDVDGAHRLVDEARIFQVQAAFDPDGTRRRLVCLVQEVKS